MDQEGFEPDSPSPQFWQDALANRDPINPSPLNDPVSPTPAARRRARNLVLAEIALVFAVFVIQGAWPVPDVNEPYYIGKAIHFWNPQWIPNDSFLDSADTHTTFYLSLGWLALFLPAPYVAWVGRLITWLLLAWSWQRLSRTVLPRRWYSVWTAALFVCLLDHGQMAGEWVIGGVEAKGFAYVLMFLGLEALAQGKFNRVWPLMGAAAAFHVLVGGWAVVAAGIAWLVYGRQRPSLRSMSPWLTLGFLLSLPGLIPSLALTRGVDPDVVQFANQLYVFERLAHHLDPAGFPPGFALRFLALTVVWAAMWRYGPRTKENDRVQAFVVGALVLALIGVAIAVVFTGNPAWAAGLLRFYWFRLSDMAVPMGVALAGPTFLIWMGSEVKRVWPYEQRPAVILTGLAVLAIVLLGARLITTIGTMAEYPLAWEAACGLTVAVVVGAILLVERRFLPIVWMTRIRTAALAALTLALLLVAPALHVLDMAVQRATPVIPRSDRLWDYWAWADACRWIHNSGEVPPDARFITPLMGQTFKWYAQRSEVVSWKDIPQDAESMLAWWNCVLDVYRRDASFGARGWNNALSRTDSRRLRYLGEKYDAPYLITFRWPRKRNFRVLYENRTYIVYRMDLPPAPPARLSLDEAEAEDVPNEPFDHKIDPSELP